MDTEEAIERDTGVTKADLRRMVGPDPARPGPDRARLVEHGVPIWAVVGHLQSVAGHADVADIGRHAIDQAAIDYQIPPAAVAAALLYYREHRGAIDARLAMNAGES